MNGATRQWSSSAAPPWSPPPPQSGKTGKAGKGRPGQAPGGAADLPSPPRATPPPGRATAAMSPPASRAFPAFPVFPAGDEGDEDVTAQPEEVVEWRRNVARSPRRARWGSRSGPEATAWWCGARSREAWRAAAGAQERRAEPAGRRGRGGRVAGRGDACAGAARGPIPFLVVRASSRLGALPVVRRPAEDRIASAAGVRPGGVVGPA